MSYRVEKFASNLKHCLADIMINDANDPSFKQISIVDVIPSPDLKKVVVAVSALEEIDPLLSRLNKAKGFLRKSLAGRLYVKFVPDLIFKADRPLSKNDKNRSFDRVTHEKKNC